MKIKLHDRVYHKSAPKVVWHLVGANQEEPTYTLKRCVKDWLGNYSYEFKVVETLDGFLPEDVKFHA